MLNIFVQTTKKLIKNTIMRETDKQKYTTLLTLDSCQKSKHLKNHISIYDNSKTIEQQHFY